MINTETMKELILTYKLAKYQYELIKQMDEDIKTKILSEHTFYMDDKMCKEEKRRIIQPFMDFLMSDDDFQIYIELCYKEYVGVGIADKRGVGYCPDNEARDIYYKAERNLIEYVIDNLPLFFNGEEIDKEALRKGMRNIKYKEKFLEVTLKMC